MKVLVAIDSFKGSLTSLEAGEAVKNAILKIEPTASVSVNAVADGGEGTIEALRDAYGASPIYIKTVSMTRQPMRALCYAKDDLLIMEVSSCIGLPQLSEDERDPMTRSSFGVGLLIKNAIGRGFRRFIVGLGGSATNDGGCGMLQALGFDCTDKHGQEVGFGAQGAGMVCNIGDEYVIPELAKCAFTVLCDVENPLLGENGCTYVYSLQKGATPEELPIMDAYLASFARAVEKYNPDSDPSEGGCGAAGGLGFALRSFTNARLVRGIDAVMDAQELDLLIDEADIVITGEGKFDGQSAQGKATMGVIRRARRKGKRVAVFCGVLGAGYEKCIDEKTEVYVIANPTLSLKENMAKERALKNLDSAVSFCFSDMSP